METHWVIQNLLKEVASYLYLKNLLATEKLEEIKKELLTRKPYLNSGKIQSVIDKWKKLLK
jgi:hypothetical protein